jgi:hypothetical protein
MTDNVTRRFGPVHHLPRPARRRKNTAGAGRVTTMTLADLFRFSLGDGETIRRLAADP